MLEQCLGFRRCFEPGCWSHGCVKVDQTVYLYVHIFEHVLYFHKKIFKGRKKDPEARIKDKKVTVHAGGLVFAL